MTERTGQQVVDDNVCPVCNGSGVMNTDGRQLECLCVLKKRAINYLTSVYATAKLNKRYDVESFKGKNLLLVYPNINNFKTIIKSFLIKSGMVYKHDTVSAYDILQAYLQDRDSAYFKEISEVDYLFILLIADPVNKHYGNIIEALIEKRILKNKPTFVYTPHHIKSAPFKLRYSDSLSEFLDKKFELLTGTVQ